MEQQLINNQPRDTEEFHNEQAPRSPEELAAEIGAVSTEPVAVEAALGLDESPVDVDGFLQEHTDVLSEENTAEIRLSDPDMDTDDFLYSINPEKLGSMKYEDVRKMKQKYIELLVAVENPERQAKIDHWTDVLTKIQAKMDKAGNDEIGEIMRFAGLDISPELDEAGIQAKGAQHTFVEALKRLDFNVEAERSKRIEEQKLAEDTVRQWLKTEIL